MTLVGGQPGRETRIASTPLGAASPHVARLRTIVEAPVAVANRRIDTCHERQRSLRRDERERMLEIGDAARDPLEDEVVVVEIHETTDVIRDHRGLPLNRL